MSKVELIQTGGSEGDADHRWQNLDKRRRCCVWFISKKMISSSTIKMMK